MRASIVDVLLVLIKIYICSAEGQGRILLRQKQHKHEDVVLCEVNDEITEEQTGKMKENHCVLLTVRHLLTPSLLMSSKIQPGILNTL